MQHTSRDHQRALAAANASHSRLLRRALELAVAGAIVLGFASIADAQPGPSAGPTERVPVATRAIARGVVLAAEDITYEEREVARGVQIDTTLAPGWTTRRVIAAGEILRPPSVQAPLAVEANGLVEVVYTTGVLTMTMRGTANRAASIGDRITVRLADGRRLDAVVTAAGRARLQ